MRVLVAALFCLVVSLSAAARAQATMSDDQPVGALTMRERELARLDARLAELRREQSRHGLLAPSILIGFGVTAGLGLSLGSFVDRMIAIARSDGHGRPASRRVRVMAGTSLIGWASAMAGGAWLFVNLRARRDARHEGKVLLEHKQKLLRGEELSLGFQGSMLVLRGRF